MLKPEMVEKLNEQKIQSRIYIANQQVLIFGCADLWMCGFVDLFQSYVKVKFFKFFTILVFSPTLF